MKFFFVQPHHSIKVALSFFTYLLVASSTSFYNGIPSCYVTSMSLQLQDAVMASDEERLRMTQNNVKMVSFLILLLQHIFLIASGLRIFFYMQLQRHFQTDTLPWIQKLKHKEQGLQRRLLRVRKFYLSLLNHK